MIDFHWPRPAGVKTPCFSNHISVPRGPAGGRPIVTNHTAVDGQLLHSSVFHPVQITFFSAKVIFKNPIGAQRHLPATYDNSIIFVDNSCKNNCTDIAVIVLEFPHTYIVARLS